MRGTPFEEQLVKNKPKIMAQLAAYTGGLFNAEEAFQEASLAALTAYEQLQNKDAFVGWFAVMARNRAINQARKRRRYENLDDRWDTAADVEMACDQLASYETSSRLMDAVAALPPRQRDAVTMRVMHEMSFKDIAVAMRCSYDTAKANYRHGMLALKKKLVTNADL